MKRILTVLLLVMATTFAFAGESIEPQNQGQVIDALIQDYVQNGTLISKNELDKQIRKIKGMDYTPIKDGINYYTIQKLFGVLVVLVMILGVTSNKRKRAISLVILLSIASILSPFFGSKDNMANLQLVNNADMQTINPFADFFSAGKISQDRNCWLSLPHRDNMSAVQFEINHACERLSVVRGKE